MRSINELIEGNVERDDMTSEEEEAFVNFWYEAYQKEGFCETFRSPFELYEEDEEYVGKPFSVIRRLTTEDCDLEVLPMWLIRFEDGHEIKAFPEEICLLEVEDYQKD